MAADRDADGAGFFRAFSLACLDRALRDRGQAGAGVHRHREGHPHPAAHPHPLGVRRGQARGGRASY